MKVPVTRKKPQIVRVPKELSGVDDGVELVTECVFTKFLMGPDGKPADILSAEKKECKIMASYERGTVSLSARETGRMISVKIDDLLAIEVEAEKAFLGCGTE